MCVCVCVCVCVYVCVCVERARARERERDLGVLDRLGRVPAVIDCGRAFEPRGEI